MEAALNIVETPRSVSPDDYLRREDGAETRHEFVSGRVYAMAGTSPEHGIICCNIIATLRPSLRGGPCRIFDANVRVRLHAGQEDVFYYPDVMVTCAPFVAGASFIREPKVIVEVLSESTERTDRVEKFHYYTQVESLEDLIFVSQQKIEVTIFTRRDGWKPKVFTKAEDIVAIQSLKASLKVSEIYQDVTLK